MKEEEKNVAVSQVIFPLLICCCYRFQYNFFFKQTFNFCCRKLVQQLRQHHKMMSCCYRQWWRCIFSYWVWSLCWWKTYLYHIMTSYLHASQKSISFWLASTNRRKKNAPINYRVVFLFLRPFLPLKDCNNLANFKPDFCPVCIYGNDAKLAVIFNIFIISLTWPLFVFALLCLDVCRFVICTLYTIRPYSEDSSYRLHAQSKHSNEPNRAEPSRTNDVCQLGHQANSISHGSRLHQSGSICKTFFWKTIYIFQEIFTHRWVNLKN